MLPSLRTERCHLTPWSAEDLHPLHELMADAGVRRYLCDDVIFSLEQVSGLLERHRAAVDSHGAGMWTTRLQPDSPIIGFCGFLVIEGAHDLELMYALLPEYWGRGLASETSRAALDYVWRATSLPHVFARTDPPNLKSVEVMKRLGMKHHSTTDTMISYVTYRTEGGR